jgi:hypothetical protein
MALPIPNIVKVPDAFPGREFIPKRFRSKGETAA